MKSELQFQSKLFIWFYNKHPEFRIKSKTLKKPRCLLMHNYLNPKNAIDGAKLSAAGLCKGFPDLTLNIARGPYHGFMLELKMPGEKPKPEQREVFEALRAQGYRVEWFDNLEKAQESVSFYLNL